MAIGEQLKRARKRADMSRADVAREVGISEQYVGAVERGAGNPTLAILQALAAASGLQLVLQPAPETDSTAASPGADT